MSINIENIVALVTGANRGVGRAITEGLLAAGAKKVYVAVRDIASVDALVEQYAARVVPIEYDLTRTETADAAAAIATDINMLVSNAGVLDFSTSVSANAIEALKYQMDGNVYPLIYLAQAFGDVLKSNGGGVFVQMNSLSSIKNFTPFTGYSASKAAAYSVTQGLRDAWAEQGTQVISVMAGPLKTDMADSAGMSDGAPAPSVVIEAIFEALQSGAFLVFPDPMAKAMSELYTPYAKSVLEVE